MKYNIQQKNMCKTCIINNIVTFKKKLFFILIVFQCHLNCVRNILRIFTGIFQRKYLGGLF